MTIVFFLAALVEFPFFLLGLWFAVFLLLNRRVIKALRKGP